MRRCGWAAFYFLLAGASSLCPSAFALDPALDIEQYAHTSWKVREGFAKGGIRSIVQTADGYLWLGTAFGLLRFDGVRNVPWQPPAGQDLPSSEIYRLLAARDGTLWIGTSKGLASWRDGRLTRYVPLDGLYIFALLEDREGSLWVGAVGVPLGKLCVIRQGGVQCYGEDGRFGRGVFSLGEDREGNLWAGVVAGLWQWKPDAPRFYSLPSGTNFVAVLGEDDDGVLLVAWSGAIKRFVEGRTEVYPLLAHVPGLTARQMLRDRNGGLWIGTPNRGLVHVHQGRADTFAQVEGLSGNDVNDLIQDREGNVWTASAEGLDRFRDVAVATFSVNQGVVGDTVHSVLAAGDGSVWLATSGGLNRWTDGRMTIPRTGSGKPDGKVGGVNPHSLFQDGRGRMWFSTQLGIGYLENGRFTFIRGVPGGVVRSFAEDRAGTLWIASQDHGLFRVLEGGATPVIPWTGLGHEDFATALAADPLRGGLWLGFFRGGIVYFADGHVRASYGAADGLGEGYVASLRVDPDGTLWAATEGGLSRLKNGRLATLTTRSGLPCDEVHWSLEDDVHSLWLYTACGLVRIARPELEAWAAAVDARGAAGERAVGAVQVTVFDSSDGVRGQPGTTGLSPQVARSSDGRLWFLPGGGVSVVDPHQLASNAVPPPVHIERLTADRREYPAFPTTASGDRRLQLPALLRDLEIDYTALSLVAPEKVRFRYKLEGRDRDWQDAGTRRQAFFSDLRPGNYRFHVIACNNSGVWNEAGASLDFSIAPAYHQTTWFRGAVLAAFLALLAALHRLRLRQVAQHVRVRMEGRLEERERIARDLHDTLLQSVQGLILMFHAVARQLPDRDPVRQTLDKTLDHADQVLAEGRDRVRDLRGTALSLSDLPAAFQRVADETARGREATFRTIVEGTVRDLHPMVLEESYCIGREALINALTHSEGQEIEIEIAYDPRVFRLRVRDDGRGIDPEILEKGGRPGHWGLAGMQERAEGIGARLHFWNRRGTGTEIELIVPAATAYRGPRAKSPRSWWRRLKTEA